MSYVDLMGNARWTEEDHTNRTESWFAGQVPPLRQMIMLRRLLATVLPPPFKRTLTQDQLAEAATFAGLLDQAEAMGVAGRRDARKLARALDHEEACAEIEGLPPIEEGVEDPHAARRAELQAVIGAATQDTLQLVAQRAAFRAAQQSQPEEP